MVRHVRSGEDTVEIPAHYHCCLDGPQQVWQADGEKSSLSRRLSAPNGAYMLTSHTRWRSAAIPLPDGMFSRVSIAVSRPLVPMLIYAAMP